MKPCRIDRAMFDFADRYWKPAILIVLTAVAFIIRVLFALSPWESIDWNTYLAPWIAMYQRLGIRGLGWEISNYYTPYNILLFLASRLPERWEHRLFLAMVHTLAEFATLFYICQFIRIVNREMDDFSVRLIAVGTLFLPVAMLNGTLWTQCDAIYTFFSAASLYRLLRGQDTRAVILFGAAFAFKLQAIFFLPAYLLYWLVKRRFSILTFLWVPAVFLAAGLPSILMGRSAASTYGVYFGQVSLYRKMTLSAPNVYAFGFSDGDALRGSAFFLTLGIFLLAFARIYRCRARLGDRQWVMLFIWSVLTCYVFLPAMHERYDYFGLVFLAPCALAAGRRWIPSALAMNFCGGISYTYFLFLSTLPLWYPAVGYCAGYAAVTWLMMTEWTAPPAGPGPVSRRKVRRRRLA